MRRMIQAMHQSMLIVRRSRRIGRSCTRLALERRLARGQPKQSDRFVLGRYDLEEQGKSKKIEDIKDVLAEIRNFYVAALLPHVVDEPQEYAEPCAGDVPQLCAVHHNLVASVMTALPESRVKFGHRVSIEITREVQDLDSIFSPKSNGKIRHRA